MEFTLDTGLHTAFDDLQLQLFTSMPVLWPYGRHQLSHCIKFVFFILTYIGIIQVVEKLKELLCVIPL
jgi:hypothetical protein